MGYAGEVKSASEVTKYSNDKGIDRIIKEDVLGLGRIHIQAKQYARKNTVGREEIQKFVGALAVVLIDGEKLAEYIYEYDLGMQIDQTIEIKKLDSDFWDSIDDDVSNSAL